jgi:hypothetical protein
LNKIAARARHILILQPKETHQMRLALIALSLPLALAGCLSMSSSSPPPPASNTTIVTPPSR